VVDQIHVLQVVEVVHAQQFLHTDVALFRERGGLGLFFDRIVVLRLELRDDRIDAVVQIGGLIGRTGDDQWRARFVDQNAVDFVHDGEVQRALDALAQVADDQVVAQVIEPVFVVGAVGDLGAIGLMPGAGSQVLQAFVRRFIGRIVPERTHRAG
jgi:hypothetical protein